MYVSEHIFQSLNLSAYKFQKWWHKCIQISRDYWKKQTLYVLRKLDGPIEGKYTQIIRVIKQITKLNLKINELPRAQWNSRSIHKKRNILYYSNYMCNSGDGTQTTTVHSNVTSTILCLAALVASQNVFQHLKRFKTVGFRHGPP